MLIKNEYNTSPMKTLPVLLFAPKRTTSTETINGKFQNVFLY